jgi:hypothetical protein
MFIFREEQPRPTYRKLASLLTVFTWRLVRFRQDAEMILESSLVQ